MKRSRYQAEHAKLQFCLFDFDEAPAVAPARASGAHHAPPGWTFEPGDAERCAWRWVPAGKLKPMHPRIQIDIQFSVFGWMWSVHLTTPIGGYGYAALEKWNNFAWSPGEALLHACSEVIERRSHLGEGSYSGVLQAAAEAMRRHLAEESPPDFDEGRFPLKFMTVEAALANPPPGGYCEVTFAGGADSASLMLWQDAGKWYRHRPGMADMTPSECMEFIKPTPAERWPGAIVGVIHPPILPAMSRQFSEWALCSVAPAQAEALARANFKHEALIYGRQAA